MRRGEAGRAPPLLAAPGAARDDGGASLAAELLLQLGEIQGALRPLREQGLDNVALARWLAPSSRSGAFLQGALWEAAGDANEALRVWGDLAPDSLYGWQAGVRRAGLLLREERTEEAQALLETLPDPDRHFSRAQLLGNLHRYGESWDEAVAAYDSALALHPSEGEGLWRLLFWRGIAHERAGRWTEAERDFEAALALNGEQADVLNYLAYSWTEQGRHLLRARSMLELALARAPEAGHIIDSLGWVHYRLGEYGLATRLLEEAASYLPSDSVVNDHLGDAYWRTGRKREARVQWRRALAAGDHPEGADYLERKLTDGLGPQTGADAVGAAAAEAEAGE